MSRVEERLYAGATLVKTMDRDAVSGASWAFHDGESANATVCERLLGGGILVSAEDGLFPGMGQQFRLKPYEGEFDQFAAERFGAGFVVCNRRTKKLQEQHSTLVLRSEIAAARREYDARRIAT